MHIFVGSTSTLNSNPIAIFVLKVFSCFYNKNRTGFACKANVGCEPTSFYATAWTGFQNVCTVGYSCGSCDTPAGSTNAAGNKKTLCCLLKFVKQAQK
jgi:hypothetical protein